MIRLVGAVLAEQHDEWQVARRYMSQDPLSRFGRGRVMAFGEELAVTEELRRLGTDRHGNCWLDLVDDEAAQEARWGRVMFRRGPWPSDRRRFAPGSFKWEDARENARHKAWREDDPVRRAELLRAVKEEYGRAPTSRTIGVLRAANHGSATKCCSTSTSQASPKPTDAPSSNGYRNASASRGPGRHPRVAVDARCTK